MKDPIVEEVRAIRRRIAEECDYDLHKLFERQKAVFAEWKGKKVAAPFHPEWRAPHAAAVAESSAKYVTNTKQGASAPKK